jgi:hypothetical protein
VRSGWGEIFDRDAKAGEAGGAEVEVPDTREKRPKVANSLRSLLGAQFVRQVHSAGEPGRGAATDHQARGQHASLQLDRLHLRHGVSTVWPRSKATTPSLECTCGTLEELEGVTLEIGQKPSRFTSRSMALGFGTGNTGVV